MTLGGASRSHPSPLLGAAFDKDAHSRPMPPCPWTKRGLFPLAHGAPLWAARPREEPDLLAQSRDSTATGMVGPPGFEPETNRL